MDNQRVNRRRRRNLPPELAVEIVDCLSLENAVHFLANVPTRMIVRHCVPRVRRMREMHIQIGQISNDYARTLRSSTIYPQFIGRIKLRGHKYTPAMDIFLRHGRGHCDRGFMIFGQYTGTGFVGYPLNFFNDLIRFYYETKVPEKVVPYVRIAFSQDKLAQWPTALLQPQMGEMGVEELKMFSWDGNEQYYYKVGNVKRVVYLLRNKHNLNIKFEISIYFNGGSIIYQQMSNFAAVCCGERNG